MHVCASSDQKAGYISEVTNRATAAVKSVHGTAAATGISALLFAGGERTGKLLCAKASRKLKRAKVISCHTGAYARWEGVNKPELLPKSFTTVIDVAGFLTDGEVCAMLTATFFLAYYCLEVQ